MLDEKRKVYEIYIARRKQNTAIPTRRYPACCSLFTIPIFKRVVAILGADGSPSIVRDLNVSSSNCMFDIRVLYIRCGCVGERFPQTID